MHAKSFTVVVHRITDLQHDARIVHALLPLALEHARSASQLLTPVLREAKPRARRSDSISSMVSTHA